MGLKLPTAGDSPDHPVSMSAGEWGEHAEQLEYDSIWVSEAWGRDTFVQLTEIAERTENIGLCTAIANVYSRTPAVLAMAATSLQHLSDGRVIVGVGPSHANIIEPIHGLSYDRPVRRTHETIELVKELTGSSETVTYAGDIFEIDAVPAMDTPVPVYNAALGEANRRATGRVADGWLPYMFPISALESGFETIARTARESGRNPDDIDVAPQIVAAVADDPEVAKNEVRSFVAHFVGTFPHYRDTLAARYPQAIEAISDALAADRYEAANECVTDELVHDIGVAGTPEGAREQLREVIESEIVDCPIIYVPRQASEDIRSRTIEELSPRNL